MEKESIDCQSFVKLMQLIADDEATTAQKTAFMDHYQKCSHCSEHYDIEESMLEFIKSKLCECRCQAPKGLIDEIRLKISSLA